MLRGGGASDMMMAGEEAAGFGFCGDFKSAKSIDHGYVIVCWRMIFDASMSMGVFERCRIALYGGQ